MVELQSAAMKKPKLSEAQLTWARKALKRMLARVVHGIVTGNLIPEKP